VLAAAACFYPLPSASAAALLVAAVTLGAIGDALLRASDPTGLSLSLWIASVAIAAVALQRRAALVLDRERAGWLAIGVLFAAGLAWRDAPPLKLLALGCATFKARSPAAPITPFAGSSSDRRRSPGARG
jgi:hypothetical protein